MAHARAFATIRAEGGMLPSDLLAQVAAGSLPGMDPEADYHLVGRERLNEAISRSWTRLLAAWTTFSSFRERLSAGDAGTTETRERWLLPLFAELGYGRLVPSRSVEVDGRSFAISHEWGSVPIHLVGAGVQLDRRTQGVAGASRISPHGLVQELLNLSADRLWGFVSNGLQLRILRDNAAITRQAYLEFDLEEMMDGEVYSDFAVLWLVGHQSRVEGVPAATCWLERWSQLAIEQGTRALDHLRDGVEAAIEALGRGFLAEPSNQALRARLQSGELDRQGYYRQLLRLVYRLIFLLVAEDRNLLHPPDVNAAVRKVYADHYSVSRLRRMAERRRGSSHTDLYQALSLVMGALDQEGGLPALGLPALGSFLWRDEAVSDLVSARLRNRDLLEAIAALAFTMEGRVRRAVDYRNLGSEELGSVYESLLELHPELNLAAGTFALATAGGHERKLTGSYYTPTSLINNLLDTALTPVLDEAASGSEPEARILNLKVVDPACGSGHFLIAAAHRIAKRLATVRTGDAEPAPEALRHALRDVIGHCVHGVDMNDMAVELCKVGLWMEALDPGRPLSFLDHRIVLGNSLLGTTPALLAEGIPDSAYRPIEGDDATVARSWLARNREERVGQTVLQFEAEARATESVLQRAAQLEALPDDRLAAVLKKEKLYLEILASDEAGRARLAADAWCAAFVAEKVPAAPAITEDLRHRLASDPSNVNAVDRAAIERLRREYGFMHWHLAFPAVFGGAETDGGANDGRPGLRGGFDVVLGNPPWERVKLQEQEWFAERDHEIAQLPGARRKKRIAELKASDPALHAAFTAALRHSEGISHLLRDSGRYPLCGRGDVNTYSVFAELARSLLSPTGRAGIIVPTGVATDDTTKDFFQSLVNEKRLVSFYGFKNERFLFPKPVEHTVTFGLLTMLGRENKAKAMEFCWLAWQTEDLLDGRVHRLSAQDISLFNPNTRTAPVFRNERDVAIARNVYQRVPVLIDRARPDGNPWGVRLMTMFHMTNDSQLFRTRAELESADWTLNGNIFERGEEQYVPLFEAKMFHLHNPAWSNADGSTPTDGIAMPRYWVAQREVDSRLEGWSRPWLLAWRNIARNTDERTIIAATIPRAGLGHSASFALVAPESAHLLPLLALIFGSLPFDFLARFKVGGVNLSFFVLEQLPVPRPTDLLRAAPWSSELSIADWLRSRFDVLQTNRDYSNHSNPMRTRAQADIDGAVFHLYGFDRSEVEYALDSFAVLRERENRQLGGFETKVRVLSAFDTLATSNVAAIASGT